MKISEIHSFSELKDNLAKNDRSYLLIYKKGSPQSDCALDHFNEASNSIEGIGLFTVDVSEVRDIHENYKITSAPTMIEFKGQEPKNTIKGCHESSYFKAILEDAVYYSSVSSSEKPQKRVLVYSTPTCTWCNTLKSYLKQHKIRFQDIDVSRDQNAAQEMANRSGQQGVPQTDINGQIIVGFDKTRINQLLEING
ncbi:MAG: thioredoxin family protein [Bacteroidales bacterium]